MESLNLNFLLMESLILSLFIRIHVSFLMMEAFQVDFQPMMESLNLNFRLMESLILSFLMMEALNLLSIQVCRIALYSQNIYCDGLFVTLRLFKKND